MRLTTILWTSAVLEIHLLRMHYRLSYLPIAKWMNNDKAIFIPLTPTAHSRSICLISTSLWYHGQFHSRDISNFTHFSTLALDFWLSTEAREFIPHFHLYCNLVTQLYVYSTSSISYYNFIRFISIFICLEEFTVSCRLLPSDTWSPDAIWMIYQINIRNESVNDFIYFPAIRQNAIPRPITSPILRGVHYASCQLPPPFQ
jgi:hypothetical protein